MAASYNFPWQLASAARGNDYRAAPRSYLAGIANSSDFNNVAAASIQAKAVRDSALIGAGSANAQAGIRAVGDLGSTRINAQAQLAGSMFGSAAQLRGNQLMADAAVKRAKIERGDTGLEMLKYGGKLAGVLGLGYLGLKEAEKLG